MSFHMVLGSSAKSEDYHTPMRLMELGSNLVEDHDDRIGGGFPIWKPEGGGSSTLYTGHLGIFGRRLPLVIVFHLPAEKYFFSVNRSSLSLSSLISLTYCLIIKL